VGSIQPGNNFRVSAHGFPEVLTLVKALNRDNQARLFWDDYWDGDPAHIDRFEPEQGDVALDETTWHREIAITPQLIVWRKLHVEVDSMGVPETEVFPDDGKPIDVNPGDVPAPDTGLLASAFEPAYILPVLGTPYDEDTVDFVYHVWPPEEEVASRGIGESAAYWSAYVIGAYESMQHVDGDPDSEDFQFGHTEGDEPEYSFIYHETLRDAHNDGACPGWAGGVYPQDYAERQTVVHEIGHQFDVYPGTVHPPVGYSIMSWPQEDPVVLPPDSFAEDELRIIRTTASV